MNPIAMTIVLVVTLSIFAWSAYRRFQLLRAGAAEPEFDLSRPGELGKRVEQLLMISFGQKKMARNEKYRVAGLAHMVIFGAFLVLGVNSVVLWVRGYDASFDVFGLLGRGTILGDGYNFLKEIFAFLALVGSLVFFYYRIVTREKRMTLGVEALVILGIIATMMIADFLYNGAWFALEAQRAGVEPHFHPAEPIGTGLALVLKDTDASVLSALAHAGFWWHASFVLIFLNLLPYSKHFHIITNWPNVFASRIEPVGKLPNVEDIEGKVEREEPIGIAKVTDLSWKHILDLYTCTECGRCSDNCPAYTTGKKLSPKHLTLALRDHLYASERRLITESGVTDPGRRASRRPRKTAKRRRRFCTRILRRPRAATSPPAPTWSSCPTSSTPR